jgi:uracil-DNA glycosylase
MGVSEEEFYDPYLIAITPMGFCFPGQDSRGSDLPPRKECSPLWQDRLDDALPNVELTLVIGMYAMKRHLGERAKRNLTETVKSWRVYGPRVMPLPHPSWRNNVWIKKHDWFQEVLDELKERVEKAISD